MGGVTAVSRLAGFVRVLVIAAVLGTTYLGNTFQAANSVSNVLFELLAAGALSAVLVPTFVTLDRRRRRRRGRAARQRAARVRARGDGRDHRARRRVRAAARPAALERRAERARRRRSSVTSRRSCSGSSCRRSCSTRSARSRPACSTRGGSSRSPRRRRSAARVVMIVCFVAFRVLAGAESRLRPHRRGEAPARGGGHRRCDRVRRHPGGRGAAGRLLAAAALGPRRSRALDGSRGSRSGACCCTPARRCCSAPSIVVGNGVAGGVVAYQVAFMFFLAPYAVLAQPIHTAILPEMSRDVAAGDLDAFARSIRWALDRMAWLVIPVSAGLVVIALPMMRLVAFGSATKTGPALLAAGIASLALGLYPYGAFLLLARSYYALGDSRTPAIVAIGSALRRRRDDGRRQPGHARRRARRRARHRRTRRRTSSASIVLGIGCRRRTGRSIVPRALPIAIAIAGVIAVAVWIAMRAIDPSGRIATVACLAVVGGIGTGVYALAVRHWWRAAEPDRAPRSDAPPNHDRARSACSRTAVLVARRWSALGRGAGAGCAPTDRDDHHAAGAQDDASRRAARAGDLPADDLLGGPRSRAPAEPRASLRAECGRRPLGARRLAGSRRWPTAT